MNFSTICVMCEVTWVQDYVLSVDGGELADYCENCDDEFERHYESHKFIDALQEINSGEMIEPLEQEPLFIEIRKEWFFDV